MKIEKCLDKDIYTLDTQNALLEYETHDGKQKVHVENEPIDFDIGRYGDGCGGGMVFVLYATYIQAFNPETKKFMLLCKELNGASSIEKKACDLFIQEEDAKYIFNLAMMKKYKV